MSRSRRLGVAALAAAAVISLVTAAAGAQTAKKPSAPAKKAAQPKPTATEAQKFVEAAELHLLALATEQQRADWVKSTFITDDTEAMAARANQAANEAGAKFAREAVQYDAVAVAADERRQLTLLKVALVLATPSNEAESDEL